MKYAKLTAVHQMLNDQLKAGWQNSDWKFHLVCWWKEAVESEEEAAAEGKTKARFAHSTNARPRDRSSK